MFDWFKPYHKTDAYLEWKKNFRSVRTRCQEDFGGDVVAAAKWFKENYIKTGCEWSDLIEIQIMLIEKQIELLEKL